MQPMSEEARAWFLGTLFIVTLLTGMAMWSDGTNERMAQRGFIPLRLQGDSKIYWLPNHAQAEPEMLKH